MANYDRRILIPYLHDICSIEMICSKLTKEINACTNQTAQLQATLNTRLNKPSKPGWYLTYDKGNTWGPVIVGAVIVLLSILVICKLSWLELFTPIGVIGILVGIFVIVMGIVNYFDAKRDAENRYYEDLRAYEKALKEYETNLSARPGKSQALQKMNGLRTQLQKDLTEAKNVRDALYNINVIPRQYRNIYAVYYIYDFMSSGRETDLEKVIQTFVLEEIKRRLDQLIVQNEQILVNQRIQIAMQERQNAIAAKNHREQMNSLARMERNQELQSDYMKMIEKNQMVTNYLLTADYVRKYYH